MSDHKPGDIDEVTGGTYYAGPDGSLRIDFSNGVKWQPGEKEAIDKAMEDCREKAASLNLDDPMVKFAKAIDDVRVAIDAARKVADEAKPFLTMIPPPTGTALATAIFALDGASVAIDAADDALAKVGL